MPTRLAVAAAVAVFGFASQLVDPGFVPSSSAVTSCTVEGDVAATAGCGSAR